MIFLDEINRQRIDTASYKLVYEFCEVIFYDGKKKLTNVKFITRPGSLVDCLILGNLTPKAGDKGIIFFVGKYNTPVFKNFNNFTTFTKAGEVKRETYK